MRLAILFVCAFALSVNVALAEPAAFPTAARSVTQTLVPDKSSENMLVWTPAGPGISRQRALHHLRQKGFNIRRLVQDGEGIWLGEAAQDGQIIDVAVDPAGNVITW